MLEKMRVDLNGEYIFGSRIILWIGFSKPKKKLRILFITLFHKECWAWHNEEQLSIVLIY